VQYVLVRPGKYYYHGGSAISGLYYKHVTIVNDASSGVNKLKASLNDAL
jgi:hypothetical protein